MQLWCKSGNIICCLAENVIVKNNSVLVIWNKHPKTKQRFGLFITTVYYVRSLYSICVQSTGFPFKNILILTIYCWKDQRSFTWNGIFPDIIYLWSIYVQFVTRITISGWIACLITLNVFPTSVFTVWRKDTISKKNQQSFMFSHVNTKVFTRSFFTFW